MATDNRVLVEQFMAAMASEGPAAARAKYATPDFVWWSPSLGEVQDKLDGIRSALRAQIAEAKPMVVHGIIAQGDRVAVEAESFMKLKNGKIYNNTYHFLYLIRDGKIAVIKEYNDTLHAAEALGDTLQEFSSRK